MRPRVKKMKQLDEIRQVAEARDALPIGIGAGALASPAWMAWFTGFNEVMITLGGLAILILTIWSKILEIKAKRKALREASE